MVEKQNSQRTVKDQQRGPEESKNFSPRVASAGHPLPELQTNARSQNPAEVRHHLANLYQQLDRMKNEID